VRKKLTDPPPPNFFLTSYTEQSHNGRNNRITNTNSNKPQHVHQPTQTNIAPKTKTKQTKTSQYKQQIPSKIIIQELRIVAKELQVYQAKLFFLVLHLSQFLKLAFRPAEGQEPHCLKHSITHISAYKTFKI